jgi:Fe-S cluster assembly protein SufD
MASGTQVLDCRTCIDHAYPNCTSHELYKGILEGASRGVFNGRIHVHQDAQKTDAKQSNQVLLLSDDAVIDTKPELEIYADDVRCTHGATVGDLDADALFYLRSRGVPADLARKLLVFAFANEIVQGIAVPSLKTSLESVLLADHGLPSI